VNTAGETTYPDLETLVAVIARSPIRVPRSRPARQLPAGFDEGDVAVLEWIAAEGRRIRGRFLRM